jgi:hypothetical protein
MCFIVIVLDAKEGRMEFSDINWLAIAIATLANIGLGLLWFGPLFGKFWRSELDKSLEELPNDRKRFIVLPFYSFFISAAFWYLFSISSLSPPLIAFLVWMAFFEGPTLLGRILSGRRTSEWESFFHFAAFNISAIITGFGLLLSG